MTVALLSKWGDQPPGTLYTTDAATEAAMIAAKVATATLTGAVAYVAPGNSKGLGAPVTAVTDSAGNPVGIAGGDGSTIISNSIMRASGIPFVMPSSGTVSNTTGAVSATTGLDYIVGPAYNYYPAGALFVASPAGWYYANWSSATACTVYANTYTSGTPEIPANPTTLTTVAGAYTQVTGFDVFGPNYVVPGNFMGPNGILEWGRVVNNNNSAGTKTYNTYFGNTSFQGISQTTNPREAGMGTLRNRGRATAQIGVNAAHGDNNNASSLTKLTIDTTVNQIAAMTIQLSTATDYAIIEGHHFRISRAI